MDADALNSCPDGVGENSVLRVKQQAVACKIMGGHLHGYMQVLERYLQPCICHLQIRITLENRPGACSR